MVAVAVGDGGRHSLDLLPANKDVVFGGSYVVARRAFSSLASPVVAVVQSMPDDEREQSRG